MIRRAIRKVSGRYYGVAYHGTEVAATAVADSSPEALTNLSRSLPHGVASKESTGDSPFVDETVLMLALLEEEGIRDRKLLYVSATMTEGRVCVKRKVGTRYCAPHCG